MRHWLFKTHKGTFRIVLLERGGVDVFFESEHVDWYHTPEAAAGFIGSGYHRLLDCFPENGETLGVSPDLSEWIFRPVG
jgi:hypothetical protein